MYESLSGGIDAPNQGRNNYYHMLINIPKNHTHRLLITTKGHSSIWKKKTPLKCLTKNDEPGQNNVREAEVGREEEERNKPVQNQD